MNHIMHVKVEPSSLVAILICLLYYEFMVGTKIKVESDD